MKKNYILHLFVLLFLDTLSANVINPDNIIKEKWIRDYDWVKISEKNTDNLCLFNVPKNSSTTLSIALKLQHHLYSNVKDRAKTYLKLFSVRNPLYRPVAIYNELLKLRKDGPYQITEKMEFYKQRNNPLLSFRLFLEEINDFFYDPHTYPQHQALTKKDLTLRDMDYIFLVENLNHDLSLFCKKNHIPYHPTQTNATPKSRKTLLKEYIDQNP